MFSCRNGHERVVEMLLNGRATVDRQEKVLLYWIIFPLNLLIAKTIGHTHGLIKDIICLLV